MKNIILVLTIICIMLLAGCVTPPPAQVSAVTEQPPASAPAAPAPAPQVSAPAQQVSTPPPTPSPPQREELVLDGASNVTIVRGESLSIIAARVYGQNNMFYFPLIRLANPSITDPDVIPTGIRVIVPNLQANLNSAGSRAMIKADMLSTASRYDRYRPISAAELRRLANTL